MPVSLRLAALVLLVSGAYYALVAFAPGWLGHLVGGLPLSILLGFGIFVAGAAISLCYAFAPASFAKAPPPRGEDA